MKTKKSILFSVALTVFCQWVQLFAQPAAPPAPTTTDWVCGNQTLTAATPPADVLYYWSTGCNQSTALGSASTYTVTATGTYYLQAYDTISGLWSLGCGSVLSTVYTSVVPADPPAITENASASCGLRKTLTTSTPPAGTTYYWQGTTCGRDASENAASPDTVNNTCGAVTYYLRAKFNTSNCWSYNCSSIIVTDPRSSAPCDPPNPTFSCGSSLLSRPNPPTNITYYWQGTVCGTDASNSAATYNAPASGTYYLKARDNCTSTWSSGCSSVAYLSGAAISDPTAITSNLPGCGLKYLTIGAPPAGVTYYWQGISCSNSTTYDAVSSYTVSYYCTTNMTYYARARDNATGCWSNGCSSINITSPFETAPCDPPAPTTTSYPTGCQTLTRAAHPNLPYIIYYWQGTACNTNKTSADSVSTYTANATNTYYLRAYDACADVWSSGCSSVLSTVTPPTVADPVSNPTTTSTSCGCQTLTRGDTPPAGVAYYWQGTSCGTDASDSNSTTIVCATGTYYIKARDVCTGAWSSGCKSVVSTMINPLPATPPAITVNEPVCGSTDFKTLTSAAAPPGVTYYWQGTSCGTSTANNATTAYTVSHIGTDVCSAPSYYYIRALDGTTGCWSFCSSTYVTNPHNATPCDPPNPTTTSNPTGCQTVTRANPPANSNATYYWQSTLGCGTSYAYGSATSIQVSVSGTYYLRARDNCTGTWSTGCGSVVVTVNPITVADPPTLTTTNNACGNQTLTSSTPPAGIYYYWQGTAGCGTSTGYGYGINYTVTATGTYYLRARDYCTGTWSAGCNSVLSTINNPAPANPPAITQNTPACGIKYLTVVPYSPPANVNYYWQGTSCGTSDANIASSSYTVQNICGASYYYLRAKDEITGCWSTNCSSTYVSTPRAAVPCDPPAPTTTTNPFGCQTITRADPMPDGITYYWEDQSCSTRVDLGSALTYSAPVTGSYNLRARFNCPAGAGAWSAGCGAVFSTVNPATPADPPNPTTTNGCGNQTLTRDVPPAGVTYYWQGTSCGTSTADASLNYTVTATGTYYLRAQDICSGGWSAGCGSVVSTINNPAVPPNPTVNTPGCGAKYLTEAAAPGGVTYYWQGTSCGTSTTNNASSSYTLSGICTNSPTYYVRAKDDGNSCWSTTCGSVTVTPSLEAKPCDPSAPTTTSNNCGDQTLTRSGSPPENVTYYWQGTSCGTNTGLGSGVNYTVTATGTYYIRAYDACANYPTGVWSDGCGSILSTVNTPATPTAITQNNPATCGDMKTLTIGASPAGVTYYWQGTSCGTSTSEPTSSPYTVSNNCGSVTYYVRAQHDASGCWSVSCNSTNVTNPRATNPCAPSAPTTTTEQCGDQTLTRSDPSLSCITYYWQGTSCGTSTASSGVNYTASSSGTYYLRARDNVSLNWSTTCSSVSVTINPTPNNPSDPTTDNAACGNHTLTRQGSVPTCQTYYWQGTSCGTNMGLGSGVNYTATAPGTYYIRARNNTTGTWSAGCGSVVVTFNNPAAPPNPTVNTPGCGAKYLTEAAAPGGVTYYWQGTSCGTSTANNASSSYTLSSICTNTPTYYVKAYRDADACWSLTCGSVAVTPSLEAKPCDPPVPTTTSNNCGDQTLTRGGSPPENVTYYWQGTSCGTNTGLGSGVNYTVTTTGTYYLRAFDGCANYPIGVWSDACTSVLSTVNTPATPTAITQNNPATCGDMKTLTIGAPPAGVTYYWQGTTCGTSTSEPTSSPYTVSNNCGSVTYYVKAQNDAYGCWSVSCNSTNVTNPRAANPCEPSAPTTTTNQCGSQTLTAASPSLSCITYYWEGTSCGTSTASPASSPYTAASSGTYYLRARDNVSLNWSTCSSVGVTVNPTPNNPPDPTTDNATCGSQTLTRAVPPTCQTYYWQGTNCAANSTANSALTYSAATSGTYYLKARNNTTLAWSAGCGSIVVTIGTTADPPVPTVRAQCNCYDILERAVPPSGVTYYWQGSSCASDMSNSNLTYTATNCGTSTINYYLKAYRASDACWSVSCSQLSTVGPLSYTGNAWLGLNNSGSSWDDATNWECGVVPTSSTDVIIPTTPSQGTNMPICKSNATSVAKALTIQPSASITVNSGKDLGIYGNWTNNGVAAVGSGGGTVIFQGTSVQTIAGSTTTVFDSVRISNTTGISIGGTSSSIGVTGDWTNNAFANNPSGTVTFSGTAAQQIKGSTASTFNILEIANSSTGVTLAKPVTVSSNFKLTQGKLTTDATNILILTSAANSDTGKTDSYVNGPMRKQALSSGTFTFPVGKDTAWRRITLSNISGGPSDFLAQYFGFGTGYGTYNVDVTLNHVSTKEYWILNKETGNASGNITLYWKDATASEIYNCTDVTVAHWNTGSYWENYAATASGTCTGTGYGSVTTNAAATTFSPFSFGFLTESPLPIELLDFKAIAKENYVELIWQTASEINNDYFTIEKTMDGKNFELVVKVKGAGNSTELQNYSSQDSHPYTGLSYYRLKQTDFDGKYNYSDMVPVKYSHSSILADIYVYPDPAHDEIIVHLPAIESREIRTKVSIEIADAMGKKAFHKSLPLFKEKENNLHLDIDDYREGMYFITIRNAETNEILGIRRFIKIKE